MFLGYLSGFIVQSRHSIVTCEVLRIEWFDDFDFDIPGNAEHLFSLLKWTEGHIVRVNASLTSRVVFRFMLESLFISVRTVISIECTCSATNSRFVIKYSTVSKGDTLLLFSRGSK